MGCGGTVLMFSSFVMPEWRVNHEFVETTCRVLDKRIGEKQGEDGPLYRPEIKIEYEAGGETYRDWHYDIHWVYSSGRENAQAILDQFALFDSAKNNRYPCWYDPTNPYVAVLVRGISLVGVAGVHRAGFLRGDRGRRLALHVVALGKIGRAAGGDDPARPRAGFLRPERRPARLSVRSAGRRHDQQPRHAAAISSADGQFARLGTVRPGWPSVSSGMALCGSSRRWLWAATWQATPIGFSLFFLIPFVLIGLGAVVILLRQLLVATGIGPTLMEISDHPLQPGRQYRLFLSQSGRLTVQFDAGVVGVRGGGHVSPGHQHPHRNPRGLSPGAFSPRRVRDRERAALRERRSS